MPLKVGREEPSDLIVDVHHTLSQDAQDARRARHRRAAKDRKGGVRFGVLIAPKQTGCSRPCSAIQDRRSAVRARRACARRTAARRRRTVEAFDFVRARSARQAATVADSFRPSEAPVGVMIRRAGEPAREIALILVVAKVSPFRRPTFHPSVTPLPRLDF